MLSIYPPFDSPEVSRITESLREGLRNEREKGNLVSGITAIASDVDGTLLSSDQNLHPRTRDAVIRAVEVTTLPSHRLRHFFLATGKSRIGALRSLGPRMKDILSKVPGVFLQGLYCVNAQGEVIYERKLPNEVIAPIEALAIESSMTLFGYDGDSMIASYNSDPKHANQLHEVWGEPQPIIRAEDSPMSSYTNGVNKLLFMSYDTDKIDALRPRVEALAKEYGCVVTAAQPIFLEVLPGGCSKGRGVQVLCEMLGVDPTVQLLAIGDAENDIGMLEMAALGVAVANASSIAKASADVVLSKSNDEGGAGAAIELFGLRGSDS